jgi:hypothetical protein
LLYRVTLTPAVRHPGGYPCFYLQDGELNLKVACMPGNWQELTGNIGDTWKTVTAPPSPHGKGQRRAALAFADPGPPRSP